MKTRKRLAASAFAVLAAVGVVAACTPPDPATGQLPSVNWSFKGTQVKVIDSQDEVRGLFGECIPLEVLGGCKDEPFLLNVAFRVKIGVGGSAQAWVVNNRTSAPEDIPAGTTVSVGDAAGGKVTFSNVQPVDLLDLANPDNHLEVVGTYTWAAEEDQFGLGTAANTVANLLKDALNTTLANDNLAGLDAEGILNTILSGLFNNLGGAFVIGLQNIENWFGGWGLGDLSDDTLGGAIYVGIGAHGALGGAIDGLLGGVEIPSMSFPVNPPPSIVGGGLYTFTGAKNFTQTFSGEGGVHQWWMTAGAA